MIKTIEELLNHIEEYAKDYNYRVKYLIKESDKVEVAFINKNVKRTAFIVAFDYVITSWDLINFISMFEDAHIRLYRILEWFR